MNTVGSHLRSAIFPALVQLMIQHENQAKKQSEWISCLSEAHPDLIKEYNRLSTAQDKISALHDAIYRQIFNDSERKKFNEQYVNTIGYHLCSQTIDKVTRQKVYWVRKDVKEEEPPSPPPLLPIATVSLHESRKRALHEINRNLADEEKELAQSWDELLKKRQKMGEIHVALRTQERDVVFSRIMANVSHTIQGLQEILKLAEKETDIDKLRKNYDVPLYRLAVEVTNIFKTD